MTQGMKISKGNSRIDTPLPENMTLDTTQSGGLHIHKIISFDAIESNYTETYTIPGPFGGTTYTIGRIRIPHILGYSPAFSAWSTSGSILPSFYENFYSSIYVESNDKEVIINGLPMADQGPPGFSTITVTIYAENLDASEV